MNRKDFFTHQRQIETPSGTIGYVEQGRGPVALFVHGVLLNGYLWRHQLAQLGDSRRKPSSDETAATADVEHKDGRGSGFTFNSLVCAHASRPHRLGARGSRSRL